MSEYSRRRLSTLDRLAGVFENDAISIICRRTGEISEISNLLHLVHFAALSSEIYVTPVPIFRCNLQLPFPIQFSKLISFYDLCHELAESDSARCRLLVRVAIAGPPGTLKFFFCSVFRFAHGDRPLFSSHDSGEHDSVCCSS